MPLALCVYLVERGIVLASTAGAKELNPYGLLAISVAAGLFTRQALDKIGSIADAIAPSEAVEQQMTRIESALGIGSLDNYDGFLCVMIEATATDERSGDDRLSLTAARNYVLQVWFQPHSTNDGRQACERVSITGGMEVDTVQFEVTADTDVGAIRPRSDEVSFRRDEGSRVLRFEFTAQPMAGNGEVWVEITQRNRLIQSLSLPLQLHGN
jgi:hypothetical protein